MRALNRIGFLFLLVAAGLIPLTAQADVRRDRPQGKSAESEARATAAKNSVAADCDQGNATVQLDVNNVRADLYNTGQLFYPAGPGYEVPKGSGNHAIFASGLWIGGLADGELRMAAATYAQFGEDYEFFPGPLNDDGSVPNPNDCTQYDVMFKVSRADLVAYDQTGVATSAMTNWPYQLGAPVVDGDGNPNNYDLAAGDRPEVTGDQTVWWVMNDAAGPHLTTSTPSIGLEVQGTAFAFATGDALNNTTFYKYKLLYKPDDGRTLENVWIGLWSDPDLGNFGDDFVGSDTTLGLGIVYNGDPLDEGAGGYGNPPAAGYDFFQGPLVNTDEIDNDGDGEIDEAEERLQMTRFVYFNNDNSPTGSPQDAEDFYGYLRGVWTDNSPMTLGGDGYGGTVPVDFMFPGEPPAFWSEDNTNGAGARNIPADRRFIMSTGPFTMEPGDVQEIVFGIIWSQTPDRIGSVRQLKADDILAQGAFNFDFNLPPAPDAPALSAAELDERIVLKWAYPTTSNNFLNRYDAASPFLVNPSAEDTTYTFEGYKIYQYSSLNQAPEDGQVIATLDVPGNNVTTIVDNAIDPTTGAPIRRVVATGNDLSDVENFFVVDQDYVTDTPLRNGSEYYFGVQAYAFNPNSDPQIRQSQIVRVTAIPARVAGRSGGTELNAEVEAEFTAERTAGVGEGLIAVRVVDPTAVTGDKYDVRFFEVELNDTTTALTYEVVNQRTGESLIDGEAYAAATGEALPMGQNLFVEDGLSFSITGPAPEFNTFIVTQNAGGALDPPTGAAADFAGFPVPNRAGPEQQESTDNVYFITSTPYFAGDDYSAFLGVSSNLSHVIPYDWEIRFTEDGGKGAFTYPGAVYGTTAPVVDVPFELWRIGVGTPDDPSDDVRYFPTMLDFDDQSADAPRFNFLNDAGIVAGTYGQTYPTIITTADIAWSGGTNDPFTDGITWIAPRDPAATGEAGYEDWLNFFETTPADARTASVAATYAFDLFSLWGWNLGDALVDPAPYATAFPEPGTVFRIVTFKPIVAGDVYTLSTEEFAPVQSLETAQEALSIIGIVPNPYKGASEYDRTSDFQDEARFINMPQQATVRIFSLDGTLVRTLRKNSPDNILRWDLKTQDGLPIASGMYIIHVDVPNVGERVIKFGVILDKIHLDVF